MKKNILALSVVTALSSLALAGCGGGGDGASTNNGNNSGNGGNATKPALTATFIDSAVAGLNYTCGNYSDVTNSQGQFLFNDGDTCTFKLGSIPLGETQVKKGQTLVTPYTIAEKGDKDRAIRIAALLQTMDGDTTPETITLKSADVVKLGNTIKFDSDDVFNASLNEALKQAQIDKKVVDTKAAEAHMNASLAVINGQSVAVNEVLTDLLTLTDLKTLHVEDKLKEYKTTLEDETTETGETDRQIVLAMLAMLEVTNDPIVAERLGFTSSEMGVNYSTNLAKVIDVIIHTPYSASVILKGDKGYTRDVAKLMGTYADSMDKVAATLADIQDPDYSTTYGDNDAITLNFDSAKALRASAMAMASALNIAASYQYGPDKAYSVQEEEVTLPRMLITYSWDGQQQNTIYGENASTFKTQFSPVDIEPDSLMSHPDFFRLTDNAKMHLGKAKAQLKQAVDIALTIDQSKLDNSLTKEDIAANTKLLTQLANNFLGKESTVEWTNRKIKYVNTGMGWEPKEVGVKFNINVIPFFDEMLDRSDLTIKVSGNCAVGIRDAELSKAMGEPMCLISSDEFKALHAQNDYGTLKYIGWMQEDQYSHTSIYAKGVSYDWSTQITPLTGSTFDKVFVSCTDLDGNKVSCADQL
ncbi:hypothetical protein K3H50_09325 [Aeromonas veronii]|uniref:hypothetical protein n=1 Tax=Aeromonas veronii TaxID=654 RepID=UPI00187E1F07|nr:hypothetical protein [Aeromonas veronii]MBE8736233.1 hypothetical protein [Aeromonas veronii]MBE8738670.1 hypothetical protein [Aeromonas veronii]MBE8744932.1 hypothetical protein [Aeromonas veronii]MBE8764295.1 hypothetical protein [Aeromonas veronii]MBE8840292.1 hypothetical protein [Aeromonas veronii]